MFVLFVFLNATLFTALSALHFFWAFGGSWGLGVSLPTNPKTDTLLFKPSLRTTLVVAIGLGLFAFITLGNLPMFYFGIDHRYFGWAELSVGFIFLLRAIGDFKYIGFFKNVKQTVFAKMDSVFYSPLCLLLSVVAAAIFYFSGANLSL